MSSWHPLFTGSAAYAELGDELHRRGLEYLNTDLPTATAYPDGSAMFLQTSMEANVAEFDRWSAGDGAAWQRQFEEFMANADLSFGVLGTELWSPGGLGLGQRMLRRLGRRGLLDFAGHALATCRDWTTATFRLRAGPRAARPVGAAHGPRPRERRLGVHDPGDRLRRPARGHARAGRRRREARRRTRRDRSRCRRRAPDRSERGTDHGLGGSCHGCRPGRRRSRGRDPRRRRRSHPDPALRQPPPHGRRPAGRPRGGAALSLRPRRDADPPRPRRAAAVERPRRGAPRRGPRSST